MEHNELEEMREQMALLNRKLDKEEIVSDEAISEVTRKTWINCKDMHLSLAF